MTPPKPAVESQFVSDIHEERIQRLEDGFREVVSSTSAQGVKIEFLAQSVEDTKTSVNESLERWGREMKGEIQQISAPLAQHLDRMGKILEEHDKVVQEVQLYKERRVQRVRQAKRWVFAGVAAAITAVGTQLGLYFWGIFK